MAIAAWKYSGEPAVQLVRTLPLVLVYFVLFLMIHNLADQIDIREDLVNKPNRPLAAGDVTERWMRTCLSATMVAFIFVSIVAGTYIWCATWCVCVLLYAFLDWDKHWLTKSLYMLVGTVAQLAAAWQIVTPIEPHVWSYLLTIGLATAIVAPIQDIRDIEGDKACGRLTLPVAIGERRCRVLVSALLLVCAPAVWISMLGLHWNLLGAGIVAAVSSSANLYLIFRLMRGDRTRRDDFTTYQFFSLSWYTFLTAGTVIIVW